MLNAWNRWKHMIFTQDSYIKDYDLEQENLFCILMSEIIQHLLRVVFLKILGHTERFQD